MRSSCVLLYTILISVDANYVNFDFYVNDNIDRGFPCLKFLLSLFKFCFLGCDIKKSPVKNVLAGTFDQQGFKEYSILRKLILVKAIVNVSEI